MKVVSVSSDYSVPRRVPGELYDLAPVRFVANLVLFIAERSPVIDL
jgi:hypothetical protein